MTEVVGSRAMHRSSRRRLAGTDGPNYGPAVPRCLRQRLLLLMLIAQLETRRFPFSGLIVLRLRTVGIISLVLGVIWFLSLGYCESQNVAL